MVREACPRLEEQGEEEVSGEAIRPGISGVGSPEVHVDGGWIRFSCFKSRRSHKGLSGPLAPVAATSKPL